MEVKLNFLMVGKTGHGKSATGNTLLRRKFFKTSANIASTTKDVSFSFSQFGNYLLLVVDGPGLEDTAMDKAEDKIAAAKHMSQALAMCYGGVDAFLFVLKFATRFTTEEKMALEALKNIFGVDFMKHVIVVITYGDNFQGAMEDEKCKDSFLDWCRKQDAMFLELYKQTEGRFMLINNRENDEGRNMTQIQEVVLIAEILKETYGRYTSQCFEDARRERERLILDLRAPQLGEEIQKHICLLTAEIENLPEHPSDDSKRKIRERVHQLRRVIDEEDKGFGVLQSYHSMLNAIEENLDDMDTLIKLGKELEDARTSKRTWGILGAVVLAAGGALALAIAPISLPIAAVAGVAYASHAVAPAVRCLMSHFNEKDVEEKKNEIERKRKQ